MKVQVSFTVEIPAEATQQEIRDWLSFELGETGSTPVVTPLSGFELEAEWMSVNVKF